MRQIVLDTETTGLEPQDGHRVIEIGCIELVNRRLTGNNYHIYLNPEREVDEGAVAVHGLTTEQLLDQPLFGEVVDDLVDYLRGAELIIHNAPFDVGFLDHELSLCNREETVRAVCQVLDTLEMARERHPGQKNSLDALCKRYEVDNSGRQLHGALLDAQLLAEVYLAMTGGQTDMRLDEEGDAEMLGPSRFTRQTQSGGRRPRVIRASGAERAEHLARLEAIANGANGAALWVEESDS